MAVKKSRVLALIPARFASKRFPGKLLKTINRKSILAHTYERVKKCTAIDQVFVVAGDEQIRDHCVSEGLDYFSSDESHICGSDRCFAAFLQGDFPADIMINVQADQPNIDPLVLKTLVGEMGEHNDVEIASLMSRSSCNTEEQHIVKVSVDDDGFASSFVRSFDHTQSYHHHIGVYGFKTAVISELANLAPDVQELDLGLEQLRWMNSGKSIFMVAVDHEPQSIDVVDQLDNLEMK